MKALGFAVAVCVSVLGATAFAGPVGELRGHVAQADAAKRGRFAVGLRPALESLGPSAVPELISEAFRAPDPSWTESAAIAWRVSVLDALGTAKDARARVVFQKVLAETAADFQVQRAAAEGLAKLGDVDSLLPLIGRDAVVSGLGSARKLPAAKALALELTKASTEARAKLIVKALGQIGNSWAWATLPDRSEELAVRHEAAKSLIAAFVKYGGEVRSEAATQLLVVDAPNTAALIAQAKAGGIAVAELDGLSRRLAASPIR